MNKAASVELELPSHKGEKATGRIRRKNEQLIVNAAKEEFAAKGYHGATIDSIARRAGLPRPNVHYYFDNKLQLYAEILSIIIDLWDDALNDLDPAEEPAVALREYIERKMAFSRNYPLDSRIFAKEILSGAPRLETYFKSGYGVWFERKTRVFREWAAQGKMDAVDPTHLMFLIWSATQHYADFETQINAAVGVNRLSDEAYAAATETVVSVILKGIGVA